MTNDAPKIIAIDHDEYCAAYVGRTKDNRQFFLTTPFVPAMAGNPGREFLALYIFDNSGNLLEAKIDDLGPRPQIGEKAATGIEQNRLEELGEVTFCRIEVEPFRLARFNLEFGLVAHPPDEDSEDWSVTAEPGDYMCFWPPWEGDYDT